LGVINSALSEGLRLYSQIKNLTLSNGTLNALSSTAFSGLMVLFFSGDDWDILKE
jgi:hypothetical protein